MPSYLHPGVYVEEIPSSSRPIASASTSIPIFAGSTDRGPIGEPQFILKWGDYVNDFGGIQSEIDYMGLSINSYFMNGGGPAYVARLRVEADKSKVILHKVPGTATAGTRLIDFEAKSGGDWGDNLFLIVSNSAAMTFELTVYLKKRIEYEKAESFSNLGMNSNKPNFVGHVLAANSKYLNAKYNPRLPAATTAGLKGVGSVQSPVYANSANIVKKGTYEFSISLDGGPMKTVEVVLADGEITVAAVFPKLNAAIGSGATVTAPGDDKILIESDNAGPNASIVVSGDLAKQLLLTAPTATFVYGESSFIPGNHGPVDDPTKDLDPADPSTSLNLTGGSDGSDPVLSTYQALFDDPMSKIRDISIIILPGQTLDGGAGQTIIDAAIANCEKTKSRMVIVDPPAGTADPKALPLPTKTYSVLYYPWLRVSNPLFHPEKNPAAPPAVLVPPSGAAAGMWAKTDGKRGVWKAPAGVATALLGITGTEVEIPDAIQDQLNPLGINCIRNIPRFSYVFWGARTLATNSAPEWRYIPIRRTAIMIERSIYDGIQWAVFEPNNHKLWASLRLNIENFMDGLFRAGAFQGEKASDAYFVRCNLGDTMTQADIDNGQVIVEVGFAPLKPAEFVIVRIQQIVGQVR